MEFIIGLILVAAIGYGCYRLINKRKDSRDGNGSPPERGEQETSK